MLYSDGKYPLLYLASEEIIRKKGQLGSNELRKSVKATRKLWDRQENDCYIVPIARWKSEKCGRQWIKHASPLRFHLIQAHTMQRAGKAFLLLNACQNAQRKQQQISPPSFTVTASLLCSCCIYRRGPR